MARAIRNPMRPKEIRNQTEAKATLNRSRQKSILPMISRDGIRNREKMDRQKQILRKWHLNHSPEPLGRNPTRRRPIHNRNLRKRTHRKHRKPLRQGPRKALLQSHRRFRNHRWCSAEIFPTVFTSRGCLAHAEARCRCRKIEEPDCMWSCAPIDLSGTRTTRMK